MEIAHFLFLTFGRDKHADGPSNAGIKRKLIYIGRRGGKVYHN